MKTAHVAIVAALIAMLFTLASAVGITRARYAPADAIECGRDTTGFHPSFRGFVVACTGHGCDHPEVCTALTPEGKL